MYRIPDTAITSVRDGIQDLNIDLIARALYTDPQWDSDAKRAEKLLDDTDPNHHPETCGAAALAQAMRLGPASRERLVKLAQKAANGLPKAFLLAACLRA